MSRSVIPCRLTGPLCSDRRSQRRLREKLMASFSLLHEGQTHVAGATIVKELDREGIPAVHIATITPNFTFSWRKPCGRRGFHSAPDRTRRINKGEGKTGTCETDSSGAGRTVRKYSGAEGI